MVKPKIEAHLIKDNNTIYFYFKHSKGCQCKICIKEWIDADLYYGRKENE